jgi:hypothetical protein
MKHIICTGFLLFCLNAIGQVNILQYLDSVHVDFNEPDIISDHVIQDYDILFIGETHGFHDNYTIAWKMIREFKQKTDFRYILAEMDWASAQKLNTALIQNDSNALKEYMKSSKGSPAWCKERYGLYLNIMELNQTTNQKIQYIGVDIPSGGIRLALKRVQSIQNKYQGDTSIVHSILGCKTLNDSIVQVIDNMQLASNKLEYTHDDYFEYNYQLNNILSYWKAANTSTMNQWDRIRDSCMYENYRLLEQHYGLDGEKMIGIWGVTHTYQQESENIKWFASQLNHDLHKRVYTYRTFYFDSECMLPADWLPGVLTFYRSKKKIYYNTNLQNDDSWATGKKPGAKDLKKASTKNSIALFNLNATFSPYLQLQLLVQSSQNNWATTNYFQSAFVVRNSIATQPFGKNQN